MIKYYKLPKVTINGAEQPAGIEWMHHALLAPSLNYFTLIQDTTPEEDTGLYGVCLEQREATPDEAQRLLDALASMPPDDPEYDAACQILATSPSVITMPEMWQLLRIFGRRLGYRFDT